MAEIVKIKGRFGQYSKKSVEYKKGIRGCMGAICKDATPLNACCRRGKRKPPATGREAGGLYDLN